MLRFGRPVKALIRGHDAVLGTHTLVDRLRDVVSVGSVR